MNNNQEIVAFIGVIGAGKDYRAKKMVEDGYQQVDFKDPLITMSSDLVGYDIRGDYEWFKTRALGIRKPKNPLRMSEILEASDRAIANGTMTGRLLLQRLGTDVMRSRDANYWANQFERTVELDFEEGRNVVCADCRFPNEITAIMNVARKFKSRFIFCDYRSARYNPESTHESEKMAQRFLGLGLDDGDEIPLEKLQKIMS